MKNYRNRIYNPRGQINPYGHSRPTYESKRKDPSYGSKAEKYLEKLVPVEKEKQSVIELETGDLEQELKDSEFGTEAEVNDFSLDEHGLEKEAETKQKEFIEEEDLEANLEKETELEQKEFPEEEEDLEIGHA